ncbi:competence type IV pilus major pilin ComGC [Holdemania massiliensis]|uniref:competence type IV pilus major pilin ComGC n=1 Tax=Holdemania massiliensis TaxID=1468449 RepID=UPI001F0705D8|nr:type II secretion system protein [Holdemania massiliensis]MCH1941033.1 type II secretion system GspH family protein [Holdemania massiliensis]
MKEKRGFTLLEMIVTVAILFVLLTILMPTMSGFASSANDQISDANLELLNFATHSYASFHEIENRDIFENISEDDARQQLLVSDGLIEQAVHPTGEGDYCWNITDQKWIRFIDSTAVGCGGEYKPTANPDGSLTPDAVKTPEPTTYPSAKPLPTYIPSAYQKACEASAGKFDIVNEICSCPDGYVLEKDITVDGEKKKVCMTTAEYMCEKSGGKYDLQANSCLCEGELIANEQGTMCVYDSVAASRKKCVADGGEWIEENGNGYCKYKDDQPFYIDEDNPNFVYAAKQLGSGDPIDFSVLNKIESLESLKENKAYLSVGSYFHYKGKVYRVNTSERLGEYSDLDQIVTQTNVFNISEPTYIPGKTYYSNDYVLYKGTWYTPKEIGGTGAAPDEGSMWHSCGVNIDDFNQGQSCKLK